LLSKNDELTLYIYFSLRNFLLLEVSIVAWYWTFDQNTFERTPSGDTRAPLWS
jgi:hypothetical protein